MRARASNSASVSETGSVPSKPVMCGQLHQTTPGTGVLSHHSSQAPPSIRLILRLMARASRGFSCSKRSAAAVSTPPSRKTRVTR